MGQRVGARRAITLLARVKRLLVQRLNGSFGHHRARGSSEHHVGVGDADTSVGHVGFCFEVAALLNWIHSGLTERSGYFDRAIAVLGGGQAAYRISLVQLRLIVIRQGSIIQKTASLSNTDMRARSLHDR